MANKQTRALAKAGASSKMNRGVSVYNGKGSNSVDTGALTFQIRPSRVGDAVDSHRERETSRRKPWKGCGDVLGRNRK